MPYATEQDIIDRVGADALLAVADRDASGTADTDTVARALADATAECDSYLSVRPGLPVDTVPASLVRVCVDLAMYHLSGNRTTEEVEKRYRAAVAWLRDVAAGRAKLGSSPPEATASGATFAAGTRQHTRDKLRGGF